jgi:hypothetical protein
MPDTGRVPQSSAEVTDMTTHQLHLLAGISIAVCWYTFAATWPAAENYSEGGPRRN